MSEGRLRIDQLLVEWGLAESRERAQALVIAGYVLVDGQKARKPGQAAKRDSLVELIERLPFVGRGGLKLKGALDGFGIDVAGKVCVDIGSSTGGFTDCLLQRGAAKVYSVDVGQGQLAWKLRCDPRVVVMERTNARELTPAKFPPPFAPADLMVIDCSFISLRKILPPAVALLRPSAKIVALLKPQFEAGKAEADRGAGVIRDPAIHQRVLRELNEFVAARAGLQWLGVTESPVLGPAGNKEFLVLIEYSG